MHRRGHCGNADSFKIRIPVQHTRREKHENNFYKFRGLQGNSTDTEGKVGASADLSQNQNRAQRQNSQSAVNPGKFPQKLQLAHQLRNKNSYHRSRCRDLKLPQGTVEIQPGKKG